MEIPDKLKELYNHWESHTTINPLNTNVEDPLITEIKTFITKRMNIWFKKSKGSSGILTDDSILKNFRFCNIYRELDKQTIDIHQDLEQYKSNFNLWLLNLVFHRFIAKPATVSLVGHLNYDLENNRGIYQKLIGLNSPKYGAAYVFPISIIQKSPFPTREKFFCLYLPKVMKEISKIILEFDNITANQALESILPTFGYNFRFHWTEILIDIAYLKPALINLTEDFYIGPGAKPTMKRLQQAGLNMQNLVDLRLDDFPYLTYNTKPVYLSAENWEGIACEFRKYTNLSKGHGRRRLYK